MNFHRLACLFFTQPSIIVKPHSPKNNSAYMQPSLFLYNRPFPFC